MSFTQRIFASLVFAGSLALSGCADTVASSAALVTDERGITTIVTDDFFLYWAKADGSVKRVSLDGGPPTTLVSGRQLPGALAVDETHIYWASSNGEIGRAPKGGGDPETIIQAGDGSGLALDANNIYFTTSAGTVQRRSKQGGDLTALAVDQKVASDFAISGVSLIWANPNAGSINEMLTDGGAAQELVKAQDQPAHAAISDSNIYWTNFGNSTVGISQRDGSDVHEIAAVSSKPDAVMGDATNVYFSDLDGGVHVASVHGGEATRLGKGPGGGKVSLAMDLTSIYWANSVDGAIIVLPKP
jgi:hypothetical protein